MSCFVKGDKDIIDASLALQRFGVDIRSRHRRTPERIFAVPTPPDIHWNDAVSLLRAVGVEVSERAGSRVLLKRGEERMVMHRPHPRPHLSRPAVRDLGRFLNTIGVEP